MGLEGCGQICLMAKITSNVPGKTASNHRTKGTKHAIRSYSEHARKLQKNFKIFLCYIFVLANTSDATNLNYFGKKFLFH